MKKLYVLILAAFMIFAFASCAVKPGETANNEMENEKEYEESLEMFSPEAAEYYLEKATGISLADIRPDWEWEYASKYHTLGENGRGLFQFTKKDGELTDEQINDYFKKVFDKTAAISQDGYNIIGYEFVGEGEDALDKTTLEASLSGWLQGWAFRLDGIIYVVYVSSEYDNEKESELDRLFYYNAVSVDITEGMQKGWDDYMSDIEENAEEIEDVLNDFAN